MIHAHIVPYHSSHVTTHLKEKMGSFFAAERKLLLGGQFCDHPL